MDRKFVTYCQELALEWKRDSEGVLTSCNDNFAYTFGYDSSERLIGKKLHEIFEQRCSERLLQADLEMSRNHQRASRLDHLTLLDNSTHITLHSILIPEYDEDLIFTGIDAISFHLPNARSQSISNKSEAISWHTILDNLPAHVYWFDREHKFLGCNKKQAETFNLESPDEIVGRTVYEFETKKEADVIVKINECVLEHKRPFIAEEKYTSPQGEVYTYLSRKAPLLDLSGNIIGVLGISFDITAKKENQRLQQESLTAARLAESMNTIAAALAHDLPGPIAVMKQSTLLLAKDLDELVDGYRQATSHNVIESKVSEKRLSQYSNYKDVLLNQIRLIEIDIELTMENMSQGEINTNRFANNNSIAEAIQLSVDNFAFKPGERELVSLALEHDFPFWGSFDGVRHIMYNLLKNALYFIAVARKGVITVTLSSTEDYSMLTFLDTGMGASDDVVESMFEQHFSARDRGAGIGLAFCAKMVKAMNGKIKAESVEGEYMRINIYLPKIDL